MVFVVLLIGAWSPGAQAQEVQDVTVRGFVTDASSGQALPGANVVFVDAQGELVGIAANADGYYQIAGVPAGRYAVEVSYVGYASYTDTLRLGGEELVTLSVAPEPREQRLEEVLVEAEDAGAAQVEAGFQRIRPADIERIPTPGPGGDLAMYLQTLPGVVAIGDRGGQLFVRGGTPSQNLILMDGTIVYKPFHIVSFFSAFPQHLVSSVDFYAGGFPARYTGRLSSVIDVTTRGGNNQSYEGSASIGPFLTGLTLEGPIVRDRISFLASVRTSVIEETAPVFLGQELPLKFGDQFVKVQSAGPSGRCSVSGLHTYDRGRIDLERDDAFTWSNYVLAGRCLTFSAFSPLVTEITAGLSYFSNRVGGIDDDAQTVDDERRSNIWRLHTNVDLTYPLGAVDVMGGFRVRTREYHYRLREYFQGIGTDDEGFMISTGVHAGLRWHPGDKISLEPSVAVSAGFGYPFSVEPRLRAYWRPWGTEAHQLSAAVGLYRQRVLGLTDERDAGAVFTAWLFPEEGAQQPEALHALLGWRSALGRMVDVSVEGYYKHLSDLLLPLWDTSARFTTTLGPGTGVSYGLDARAEFERRPLYLYVGYGYSWTQYSLRQESFSEVFGVPIQDYHPAHDRRHNLNIVASLDLGEDWLASARWQYGSGLPYTPPLGFDAWFDLRTLPDVRTNIGSPRFLFRQPFGARLPAYHRLDASVERAFDLARADLTVELGAINLYNRANLFYFDLFTQRRVDQLPLVPYLSLQLSTR